jgi:co-chaperonin GroES (HSP10)
MEPLEDRLVVKEIKEEAIKTTASGIAKVEAAKTFKAIVQSVGPGRYATETGIFMATVLAKNDVILLQVGGNGIPIEDGEQEFLLIRESDVLMRISEKETNTIS